MNPAKISPDFANFVNSLGWTVAISKHEGFKGHLNPDSCSHLLYWANYLEEMAFHIPYYMPCLFSNSDSGNFQTIAGFQNLVSSDFVSIVWMQSTSNGYHQLASSLFAMDSVKACIFIIPVKSALGLYSIKICCAPNLHDTLVSNNEFAV